MVNPLSQRGPVNQFMEIESFLEMVPADRLEWRSVGEPMISVDMVLGFISRFEDWV